MHNPRQWKYAHIYQTVIPYFITCMTPPKATYFNKIILENIISYDILIKSEWADVRVNDGWF